MMSIYWEKEIEKLEERLYQGEDVEIDLEAARKMVDPAFHGDYERAIDSVLLDMVEWGEKQETPLE